MQRAKEGKRKAKGAPLPSVPILQKFLKTYEKHCTQTQTSMCPAIKRDLKTSILNERILRKVRPALPHDSCLTWSEVSKHIILTPKARDFRKNSHVISFLRLKFTLVRPVDSPPSILPISLEPLLMTIREECYALGKICIWGLQLSNAEIARLASLLELKGRTTCPFTTLELIDCKMDLWSLERLGKALQFSSLRSLVLDYCKFGNEEIESIVSGLENNQRLQGLSLRYCGLGPQSGPGLGAVISQSAVCELHLDGNYLQCSGALALLRPIAEYAEMQGRDWPTTSSPDTGNPPGLLQGRQGASSTLNLITKSPRAVAVKTTSGKKRKKGIKKKVKGLTEAGPWLVKLHLADNSIDEKGKGEKGLLAFTQILTRLIKYSAHLREIDLGNNVLGEMAAADVLEALRARKTGKLPVLKVTVTPQISSDTFRSIWKDSKISNITRKKKKKAKN